MINLNIFVCVVNMYLLNKLSVVGFLTSEVCDFAKIMNHLEIGSKCVV